MIYIPCDVGHAYVFGNKTTVHNTIYTTYIGACLSYLKLIKQCTLNNKIVEVLRNIAPSKKSILLLVLNVRQLTYTHYCASPAIG